MWHSKSMTSTHSSVYAIKFGEHVEAFHQSVLVMEPLSILVGRINELYLLIVIAAAGLVTCPAYAGSNSKLVIRALPN